MERVHNAQEIFRSLVQAMSRPGTICDIAPHAAVDNGNGISPYIMSVLMTLLDGEVKFAVAAEDGNSSGRLVRQLTYADYVEPEEADYIVVPHGNEHEKWTRAAISSARTGTLESPERAATIIMEVENLKDGADVLLRGPGIEDKAGLKVDGYAEWLDIRREKNREFPLGVDMLLLDKQGSLAALPRTTQTMRTVLG